MALKRMGCRQHPPRSLNMGPKHRNKRNLQGRGIADFMGPDHMKSNQSRKSVCSVGGDFRGKHLECDDLSTLWFRFIVSDFVGSETQKSRKAGGPRRERRRRFCVDGPVKSEAVTSRRTPELALSNHSHLSSGSCRDVEPDTILKVQRSIPSRLFHSPMPPVGTSADDNHE